MTPSEFEIKNPPYYLEPRHMQYSIHLKLSNGGIFFRRPLYITPTVWTFIHQRHESPYVLTLNKTEELYKAYSQFIVGTV
jgi:hypothetical protein